MPRYVVLQLDHPTLHWDLMLESGGVLRTWRLAAPPGPGSAVPATPSFDHRLMYLDYEGPVSNNRGTVRRWDAGVFEWAEEGSGRLTALLNGTRLRGKVLLEARGGEWFLSFEPLAEG